MYCICMYTGTNGSTDYMCPSNASKYFSSIIFGMSMWRTGRKARITSGKIIFM